MSRTIHHIPHRRRNGRSDDLGRNEHTIVDYRYSALAEVQAHREGRRVVPDRCCRTHRFDRTLRRVGYTTIDPDFERQAQRRHRAADRDKLHVLTRHLNAALHDPDRASTVTDAALDLVPILSVPVRNAEWEAL